MNERINALAGAIALAVLGLSSAQAQDMAGHEHGQHGGQDQHSQVHEEVLRSLTPAQRQLVQRHMRTMSQEERERMMQRMRTMTPEEHEKVMREHIQQMQQVTVTGSLLPRSQLETFVPSVTITSEDIARSGLRDVSAVLRASTMGGGGVGESGPIGNGSMQATKSVNLFGLGPSYTKVLINGHPFANFPMAASGGNNDGGMRADLANIPMSMIDRIDILPGSQSATYGADAVAGVVNIILKRNVEGITASARANVYTEGGGASERFSLVGGHGFGDATSLTWAVQYDHAEPLMGTDRELTAYTPWGDEAYAINNSTGQFLDPGVQGCRAMGALFGGTTTWRLNDDGEPFCGSDYTAASVASYDASRELLAGYLSLEHSFSDNLQLYADLNYAAARTASNCCVTWWIGDVVDTASGIEYEVSRDFALEEIGGFDAAARRNRSRQYDATVGLRGAFGQGDWQYDAYYSRSAYSVKQAHLVPIRAAMSSYLTQRYSDISQVFVPLTPAEYAGFSHQLKRDSDTMTQQLTARVYNTGLFDLPGGSAGLAVLAEAGNESWTDTPDDMYRAGLTFSGAQQASDGDRDRYGLAAQMDLPLLGMLTATLAGRYDDYRYSGIDKSKTTWKAGLEFRPSDSLLLRASTGTSFRVADMSYLYAGPSFGQTNTYDLYRCDLLGVPRTSNQCRYVMGMYNQGNLALEPVTSKSRSIGFVWSPLAGMAIDADYMDIELNNEARALSTANILFDEAACRQGGTAAYLSSCDDALARVTRGDDGLISRIDSGYFNTAKKRMKLMMAGADYRLPLGDRGDWRFRLNYSRVLDYELQLDPVSPLVDVIENPRGGPSYFERMLNATVSWQKGPLSVTLWGVRYGKTPNFSVRLWGWEPTPAQLAQYGAPGYDPAWVLFNGSVQYQLPSNITVSLAINNIANKMPPSRNWTSSPYHNSQLYNIYGRALSMELSYRF